MSVKRQHMVKIKFSGRNLADLDFFTKSDPFLLLSRPSRIGPGYNQVRKTETINNNLNPDWKVLYIPLSELCDNDYNMKLKIEVFDEDSKRKNEEIGSCQLSLQEMHSLASSGSPTHLKWKMKVRGAVHVMECTVENPAEPQDNRISQDSLFSRPGSMAGYPDSRQGSISGFPGSRQGSIAGYPDSRHGSIAGYPGSRHGSISGFPDLRKGSMSGYSHDSISGFPLPASLQLQGHPQGAGYPSGNQSSNQYPRPDSIAEHPSQPDPGYNQSQPPGYPPSQPSGYPPSQPSGYPQSQPSGYPQSQPSGIPLSQTSGYPPSQPSGYPSSQTSGYPTSQPSGYPPSQPSSNPQYQPSGYPPSQSSGYPPSQPSLYPPQGSSGYPSSSQSFYQANQGPGYPPQNEVPDSRHSYLKNNPGHLFSPQ